MDSLGLTWIHLVSLGPTWTHLASLGQALIHSDSFGFMLSHSVSLGLSWFHSNPLILTWFHVVTPSHTWLHSVSRGLTWTHLVSLGLTWSHLASLGFIWIELDSLDSHREKGEARVAKGKREAGSRKFEARSDSTSRARARTHEPKPKSISRLDSPPNLRFLFPGRRNWRSTLIGNLGYLEMYSRGMATRTCIQGPRLSAEPKNFRLFTQAELNVSLLRTQEHARVPLR